MGFVDGSMPAPPKFVASSSAADAHLVPNPAYDWWYDQDQHVLSGLLSSITEEILQDVESATTSKEAWDILERMFSSATHARAV